ncbi:MAG: hypothetical protein QMD10_11680, partial [Desulfitobacteriaceae bacterium]|nr:hypothetical protein [Desulfitobacteriaceae bacterium]
MGEGWRPYFHKTQRRWYIRKGDERRIVARELEDECKRIVERAAVPPAGAEAVQELRRQGLAIEEIMDRTGMSRASVYRALDMEPDQEIRPRGWNVEAAVPPARQQTFSEEEEADSLSSPEPYVPSLIGVGIVVGSALLPPLLWVV